MTKFEAGKTYYYISGECRGKDLGIPCKILNRTAKTATIYDRRQNPASIETRKVKIYYDENGEYLYPITKSHLSPTLHAFRVIDDNIPASVHIQHDNTTSASDNDSALASQPAIVETHQSENNDDAKSLLDPDYFKGKSIDEIKRAFSPASLKQLKGFALCYTIPYFNRMNKKQLIDAIASKISLILEERKGYMTAENVTGDNGYAQQDDIIITATKPRTIPEPVRVKFIPGTVYAGNDSGNHFPVKITARNADFVTTDFIGAYIKDAKIQTIAGVEYAVFPTQYRNIEIWADKIEPSETAHSETNAQHVLPATAQRQTYDNNAPVMEDLAARAFRANDLKTIRTILRWETRETVNNFAQYMNISIPADADKREGTRIIAKYIVNCLAPIPPDNLYDDGSFSDAPSDNSCPEQDIPHDRTPDEIPAEINDITPKPEPQPKTKPRKLEAANDLEHKLIETKDLHFQERRNALDHNAAVISSCLFHEAIVSMLLKISPAAIIQLGFHMGLFIAKPKGKKIAIAEAFAKRLIERRDLHAVKSASVHTHTAKQTSINTASIPNSVKFFETKHGQLAFMFTDELMFTD